MFCPKCGKQIQEGSQFCEYCGTRVSPIEELKPSRRKRRKWLSSLLILIIAVVLASSALAYLYFFPRVNPEKSKEYENQGLATLSQLAAQNGIMDQEKLKEVSNDFQRAIKLDPDNLSARKNLIYTYLLSDDLSEAQKEIGEILKVNPNDDFALKMQELLGEETP